MAYNIFISIYSIFVKLASVFHVKARLFVKGRNTLYTDLIRNFNPQKKEVVWFHCASLGEFEQGRPVIEQFKKEFPGHYILLTFYSPSGYELRKDYKGADYISYLPIDTAANSRKFLSLTKPSIAFFVKYEFWPNYLKRLHHAEIPVISFSTIFRKEQTFFKWYGYPYRKVLKYFKWFFLQNEQSAELIKKLSIANFSVTGDTRFDRVAEVASNPKQLPQIERFINNKKCLVIGSSWPQDMEVLLPVINQHMEELKIIIAPHEIHEKEIGELISKIQVKAVRLSQWTENKKDSQVLIIDSIGLLSSVYQFADIAYIGGAFGKGLHNTLEAVIYEIPVIFGNRNYSKFQEARDLIALEVAWPVGNDQELKNCLYDYLENTEKQKLAANILRSYIRSNLGATDQIIKYCKKQIL